MTSERSPERPREGVATERITPAAAARLLAEQGYAYLDVRTEQEFALEHVAGAYNVPWKLRTEGGLVDNPDFVRVVAGAFGVDGKLVLGCRSGTRSLAAAAALHAAGFTQLVEQRAGHEGPKDAFGRLVEPGWAACGLPCSSSPEPGHDYTSLRRRALGA